MRVLCVFGEHNYGDPNRGEGYEYTSFIPALRRLGHEVLFMESWNRSRYSGFRELNAALLRLAERERPDVVLSVMFTYEIWLETWEILRDAGFAATVNWTTDDSWKYQQSSRLLAPVFHAFATTYRRAYARYHRDGLHNVLLTQWGANAASSQPPLPAADCLYQLSFVGTAHGSRPAVVDTLRRHGIEVECFGHGWPHGPVAADDIPRIIRSSVISLNFANSRMDWNGFVPRRDNQLKARTFEVPGAGGFLLTEWADDIEHYYVPGQEIAVYENFDDLVHKIHYYLDHPRERDVVAQAGFQRTCTEHTYDLRLAEVIGFALAQRDRFFAERSMLPTEAIDWRRFQSAAESHTLNGGLGLLRRLLVSSCSAIWGSPRGPRAARRLVFELSWRLAGKRTYSAAGWPGRMFYREG